MSLFAKSYILFLSISCLFFGQFAIGQSNKVNINPYTQSILIGEQIRVDISAYGDETTSIVWPQLVDTITKEIMIVSLSETDTIFTDTLKKTGITGFKKQLLITSFDSGLWAFPELTIIVDSLKFSTEAFLVDVNTIAVDTSEAFIDIVPPIEVPMTFVEWIQKYYVYGLYGYAIILVLAIIAYFVGKDAIKDDSEENIPHVPAHIIAFERLDQLKSENLWQTGAYKAYHIQISDITRQYIENRFHIPVLESTTDEIKHLLKQTRIESGLRKEIVSALRISDLAKFAKAIPLADENEFCMVTTYKLVEQTQFTEEPESENHE